MAAPSVASEIASAPARAQAPALPPASPRNAAARPAATVQSTEPAAEPQLRRRVKTLEMEREILGNDGVLHPGEQVRFRLVEAEKVSCWTGGSAPSLPGRAHPRGEALRLLTIGRRLAAGMRAKLARAPSFTICNHSLLDKPTPSTSG